jgi:hypothetical protein
VLIASGHMHNSRQRMTIADMVQATTTRQRPQANRFAFMFFPFVLTLLSLFLTLIIVT